MVAVNAHTPPPTQQTGTTVVRGRAATYADRGDGAGLPLLALHGWTGSKEDYDAVVAALAGGRRVVVPDLPGHGGSAGPPDPAAYGLAAQAGWVLAFADAVGLEELHLVGHSHGGLVAQRVALAASQRLRSLVLVGTGIGAVREEVAERVVRVGIAARDHGMAAAWAEHLAALRGTGAAPGEDPREEFLRRRFVALEPAAVVGGARNLISAVPLGAFLRGIDVPTLVLHGEGDDTWTHAEQALLARVTRGAVLRVIPDALHSPQVENPTAWIAEVAGFVGAAERIASPQPPQL